LLVGIIIRVWSKRTASLAGRDDRRTRLPADRAAEQVNDFLAPTRFAAGNATYMGFRPAGTFSFSHIQELSGFK
jgi:hypothetical protein